MPLDKDRVRNLNAISHRNADEADVCGVRASNCCIARSYCRGGRILDADTRDGWRLRPTERVVGKRCQYNER